METLIGGMGLTKVGSSCEKGKLGATSDARNQRAILSAREDDVAFRVEAKLLLMAADAAHLHRLPDGAHFALPFIGRFDDEALVTVLAAVLAGMRANDSFGSFARDRLGHYQSFCDGSASERTGELPDAGLSVPDVRVASAGATRSRSARIPPSAPITPDASVGRKIVLPFPCVS